MFRQWITSSGNQSALLKCEEISLRSDANHNGALVFVMGAPYAGASAVALQLMKSLARSRTRVVFIKDSPWTINSDLRLNLFQSLNIPAPPSIRQTSQSSTRPYESAFNLRCYEVIIIDGGHEYFYKNNNYADKNLTYLLQLTTERQGRLVFVFGYTDILVALAGKAKSAGVNTVEFILHAMNYDGQYFIFVDDLMRCYSGFFGATCDIDVGILHRCTNGSVGKTCDLIKLIVNGVFVSEYDQP